MSQTVVKERQEDLLQTEVMALLLFSRGRVGEGGESKCHRKEGNFFFPFVSVYLPQKRDGRVGRKGEERL